MKVPIVCNTGPLIALSLLSCQDILCEIFQPIIPQTVFDEWSKGAQKGQRTLPQRHELAPTPQLNPVLGLQLDPGEASVIQTALERGIKTVLIDERKGRKMARRVYGLQTLGTAGRLVMAKRHGLIGNLAPLFNTLEDQSYWIANSIVAWALKTAGE
jgi:predicted nucleic acid-binding protein